jgi:cell division protease FtsH
MNNGLGPLVFGEKDELIFLGREISEQRNYSDEVARRIDEEVHNLATEAHERAREILERNNAVLDDMSNALVEIETLEGDQLKELINRVVPLSIHLDSTYGENGRKQEVSQQQPGPVNPGSNIPPLPSS